MTMVGNTSQAEFNCGGFAVFRHELQSMYIALCIVQGILVLPTLLSNAIIICTIYRTLSLHTPSNMLLCSLALSDFCVALIAQPGYIVWKIAQFMGNETACTTAAMVSSFSAHVFVAVSTLTMTAIACDRSFMLYFHLRYSLVVTFTRVRAVVVITWVISGLSVTIGYFNQALAYIASGIVILLCLTVCTVNYCLIYRVARRHQKQIGTMPGTPSLETFPRTNTCAMVHVDWSESGGMTSQHEDQLEHEYATLDPPTETQKRTAPQQQQYNHETRHPNQLLTCTISGTESGHMTSQQEDRLEQEQATLGPPTDTQKSTAPQQHQSNGEARRHDQLLTCTVSGTESGGMTSQHEDQHEHEYATLDPSAETQKSTAQKQHQSNHETRHLNQLLTCTVSGNMSCQNQQDGESERVIEQSISYNKQDENGITADLSNSKNKLQTSAAEIKGKKGMRVRFASLPNVSKEPKHSEKMRRRYLKKHRSDRFNIHSFKKRTLSVFYVYLFFLLFYFPYLLTALLMTVYSSTILTAVLNHVSMTILYANSTCNPIIYCWKMKDLRSAVKQTIKWLGRKDNV